MTEVKGVAEPTPCPTCGASNRKGKFCRSCGASLDGTLEPAASRPSAERSRAAYDLHRATKVLAGVRGLFGFFALIGLGTLALGIAAWSVLDVDDTEERMLALVLMILSALQLAIGVLGVVRSSKEPLLWGVTLAALCTVNLALRILWMPAPVPIVIESVFTLFAWAVVPNLAKARRLLQEHPDLRIAQRLRGTFQRREVAAGEIQAKLRERDALAWQRRWKLVATGVLVVGIGTAAVYFLTRPDRPLPGSGSASGAAPRATPPGPLEPRVAIFESAWGRNDFAAICELFASEERERASASTKRFLERRGWLEALPKLGSATITRRGKERAQAAYEVAGRELRISWRFGEQGWTLGSFTYEK